MHMYCIAILVKFVVFTKKKNVKLKSLQILHFDDFSVKENSFFNRRIILTNFVKTFRLLYENLPTTFGITRYI